MTTDTSYPSVRLDHPTRPAPRSLGLRTVLAGDAALSLLAGVIAVAAAGPLADAAGLDTATPLRWIGLGLLVLGLDLAILPRSPAQWVERLTPVTVLLDVGWVLASIVVAVNVDLATWAVVAILVQASAVGAIAAAKWITLRR